LAGFDGVSAEKDKKANDAVNPDLSELKPE